MSSEQELLDARIRMMLRLRMAGTTHAWAPDHRDRECLLCPNKSPFRRSRIGHLYVILEEP